MNERDRILSLVKQGVLSTEEALLLLENLASGQEGESAENIQQETVHTESVEESKQAAEEEAKKALDEREAALEAAKIAAAEAEAASTDINQQIKAGQERLQVFETMEELEENFTPEQKAEKEAIQENLRKLASDLDDATVKVNKTKAAYQETKQAKWQAEKEKFNQRFEMPEDWKETAQETVSQVGDKVTEAGNQLGKFIKSTVAQVVDSVDWKDVNIKVPGIAGTKFEHEFLYPNAKASIVNVKVANGNVVFKTWDEADIKIEAKIKIYGKLDTDNTFEAFLERSQIKVDDEVLNFSVPNKRVRTDLVFYLPKRVYDHVSVKMLNGDLSFVDLETKDMFMKVTNGNFDLQRLKATMIEIEGVNGNIQLVDSQAIDFLVNTVNGNVTLKSDVISSELSTVTGTIRATLTDSTIQKLHATSLNGTIKVALPEAIGIEGEAVTNLGRIQRRLANVEVIQEKTDKMNQSLTFRRLNNEYMMKLDVKTKTGNILLKDSETSQSESPQEEF